MASLNTGLPGVSAFLQSLLRDLDVAVKMGAIDYQSPPIKTELKEMENLLRGFEYVVLDGERRRQLGDHGVERWMDDLKDLLYDIDDLFDQIKLQQEITRQPSNSKVSYNFYQGFLTMGNIKKTLKQLLCILRERTEEADRLQLKRDVVQHNDIWLASQAKIRTKTGCFADEYMIHGREEDKSKIIQMLLAEDGEKSKRKYEFVCIVGMGGLGKTTLAQLVFQDEKVKRFFAVRSWTCVSDVFDVIKVTRGSIESAAENSEKKDWAANMPLGLPALQARLKNIISDQKFLLVLDDVWTANVFKELIGPLNFGAKGSKILVTTRLRKVAEDLGKKESFRIGRLKDAQCLKIFKDNAFAEGDGIDNDEDLMKMGEEIIRKCKGVPLVAKVIGSLLKGEDEDKWKNVKDNDLWDLAYKDEDFHPALRLSYFYLSPFLKRCFEYFALFPSDFKFDQGELVRLWMAEGLIEVKEGTEPEETGDQYYNDLKRRSLIEENNMIHDMVHYLACTVSGISFFCGSGGSSSSTASLQCVRHAFIRDKPELLVEANKLRTLVHEVDICPELLSHKYLRVLVAYNRSTFGLSYLQSSLGCDLKHLRYLKFTCNSRNHTLTDSISTLTNLLGLDLSYCGDLANLPQDIGKLSNLRFLRIYGTAITGLPDSVCSLSNLRVLDVSFCKRLTTLPQDVGNLQSLHELKLQYTSVASLPESVVNATNLRVLELDYFHTQPAHIGNLSKLKNLDPYRVGKEQGRGIDQLKGMNRLKGWLSIMNMEDIECAEDALMANLSSKKHLDGLYFRWNDFDGRDAEMEVRVLEALEPSAAIKYLYLENYVGHKFPSWMSTSPLHNLTRLYLTNLFSLTEATGMELRSLQDLQLKNCPSLREVSMRSAKLKALKILQCKELKPASLVLPLLWDDLETLDCDYYYLDHFVQLLKSTNASVCTKLKKLTVLVGGDKGITSLPEGWPSILTSVEFLTLEDLPPTNFKIISEEDESSCVVPFLVSISSLDVINCPVLVSLESLELPPRLKNFIIRNCPHLRSLPYGLSDMPSLKKIVIPRCLVLQRPSPSPYTMKGCKIYYEGL